MNILAIETSCDETAAAVVSESGDVARPWMVRSSIVASQVEVHREWGGVVPEIASRQHVRDICGVVERAVSDAKLTFQKIDANISAIFWIFSSKHKNFRKNKVEVRKSLRIIIN